MTLAFHGMLMPMAGSSCSTASSDDGSKPLRVHIQQPALPIYRLPVYVELAKRQGISFQLDYGSVGDITNAQPQGFQAQYVPMKILRWCKRLFWWHQAQWSMSCRKKSDVLVLSWNLHYLSLIPALLRARLNGVGTVLWGHGYSKHETPTRRWLRDWVGSMATATLFYNRTAAQRFVDDGAAPASVFIALNSLDQQPIAQARDHWLAQPEKLAAFRRSTGLGDGPVILFVSRFEEANRLDVLLEAAAMLKSEYPTLKLALVGKGEPEMSRLKGIVRELELDEQVLFPGAIYDQMQLAPWFLCADVYCYPVNMGLSILHAFGYGLPVVTSDRLNLHGPEIEAIKHEGNGLLYAHDDPDSLARTLKRILSAPPLKRRLGQAALATVQQEFSIPRMVDAMEAAIRYAAAHARDRRPPEPQGRKRYAPAGKTH